MLKIHFVELLVILKAVTINFSPLSCVLRPIWIYLVHLMVIFDFNLFRFILSVFVPTYLPLIYCL